MNEQAHDILRALMSPRHYLSKYEGQPVRTNAVGEWYVPSLDGTQLVWVYPADALYRGSEPDFEEIEL